MPNQKDRVIIDTNLWISFLLTKDYSKLDKILSNKRITLIFSHDLIDEFTEVIQRPKFKKYFSIPDIQSLLLTMRERGELINVISETWVCRDAKDNFLLSLAKDGNATHLLTGDKDLLVLKTFGTTEIITITEYLLL